MKLNVMDVVNSSKNVEEVFSDDGEDDVIDRTWKRLENDLEKVGFREGADKGVKESYQNGFDSGYVDGFSIGEEEYYSKGVAAIESWILKKKSIEKLNLAKENELTDERSQSCHENKCEKS